MKQTVLNNIHLRLNAKMTEFQGWQVPLQYTTMSEEHFAVRTAVGLFDVSWLGRIEVSGGGAIGLLQRTFTRNISRLAEGSAIYGMFLNESGCILDDTLLMRLPDFEAGNRYILCTNAKNAEKLLSWLGRHAAGDAVVADRSNETSQLALQGPRSEQIIESLSSGHYKKLKQRHVRNASISGIDAVLSRTGYTGEHGYEIIVSKDKAEQVWNALMEAGRDVGIQACGLAARDILRLEMGYVMYGVDIDETKTPIEAGLSRFVDFKKDFIGKEALLKQKSKGAKQRLIGFVLAEKAVPKSGSSIFSENRDIGVVTSAAYSPSVYKGIGLGYVLTRYAQAGQEIEIEVKDREIAAKIVDTPFYKKKLA